MLNQSIINDYLAARTTRMLQIGSGGRDKEGWLNTDARPSVGEVRLDASEPFPLPDESVHYVYSEHFVEHLTFEAGMTMLRESFRVLARGGKMRIATPSLARVVAVLLDPPPPGTTEYVAEKARWHGYPTTADPACFLVNHQMRAFGHQFLYTPRLLRARLEEAGFTDVREYPVGESDDPVLRDLESRARWGGATRGADVARLNAYETFVLEGTRP